MQLATALNSLGLLLGFVGALIIWAVSRREGPGLPFLADAKGKLLAEAAAESRKRDYRKNVGMALICMQFPMPTVRSLSLRGVFTDAGNIKLFA